jgi:hypothetical protein
VFKEKKLIQVFLLTVPSNPINPASMFIIAPEKSLACIDDASSVRILPPPGEIGLISLQLILIATGFGLGFGSYATLLISDVIY